MIHVNKRFIDISIHSSIPWVYYSIFRWSSWSSLSSSFSPYKVIMMIFFSSYFQLSNNFLEKQINLIANLWFTINYLGKFWLLMRRQIVAINDCLCLFFSDRLTFDCYFTLIVVQSIIGKKNDSNEFNVTWLSKDNQKF